MVLKMLKKNLDHRIGANMFVTDDLLLYCNIYRTVIVLLWIINEGVCTFTAHKYRSKDNLMHSEINAEKSVYRIVVKTEEAL